MNCGSVGEVAVPLTGGSPRLGVEMSEVAAAGTVGTGGTVTVTVTLGVQLEVGDGLVTVTVLVTLPIQE